VYNGTVEHATARAIAFERMPFARIGNMAGCERGYLCIVCGEDVEEISDSVLYLRYVLGEVDWHDLDRSPEKHVRCDPVLAQFIVSDAFEPMTVDGVWSKTGLDPEFVKSEEARVTSGFLRLREIAAAGVSIADYPLAHAAARYVQGAAQHES
jgi:hypothetical protein